MRFPLVHRGRRFFFFTFTVEGRRRVLSRLVRGEKRPVLSANGERVAALWRRLHAIEAHFTASDFVVMPDHVHLLLIVNSAGEFRFNPLVFAHWFMEATTGSDGDLPPANSRAAWDRPIPSRSSGMKSPSFAWDRDCWVEISFDSRQLSAIRRYIRMNPARHFWKTDHPDLFRLREGFRHPALDPSLAWSAVGDITILASPFLLPVRLSMQKSAAETEGDIAELVERARRGWIPVCGFLSPGEREFARRLKALPRSRWIKAVPYGLPERHDPSVEDSRWIAERRELVLSAFRREEIPPFRITRRGCLAMNGWIAKLGETNVFAESATP